MVKLIKEDVELLEKVNDTDINIYIDKMQDYTLEDSIAIDFYELLGEKSERYLNEQYNATPESDIIEKVMDYIYDKTNN